MSRERTVKGRMGALQRLLARLNGNREDLPQLEMSRARLEELIARVVEAADRQALYSAVKQEASRELQSSLAEGERLATVLQMAVRQHYGIRSEKLVDFGLKPFRGRKRRGNPGAEPQPAPPAAEEPSPPEAGGTNDV